jgi:hypothetical protein
VVRVRIDRKQLRYDHVGPRRCVGVSDDGKWVLVRRPGAATHAMTTADFLALSPEPLK